MSENLEPTKFTIERAGITLLKAPDPLAIRVNEYATGQHLKVVGLANCAGVGLVGERIVAAHISPFGGDNYYQKGWIEEQARLILNFLKGFVEEPTEVYLRSREIGSRPFFHGTFYKLLREYFPKARFDTLNAVDLEIFSRTIY